MSTLLQLAGVTRTVHLSDESDLHILTGVDLTVTAGDHVGIIGRSGSGKSTLLNILGLLDRPTAGTIEWDGNDAGKLSARQAARIRGRDVGFVFQQFNLLPGRTALENVAAPLMYAPGRWFWNRREIAAEMLERVGLGARIDSMPESLSGGEQQRVAIARALVRGPKIVLADEPTGALDVETGEEVMAMLDAVTLETGSALITITHDVGIAQMARQRFKLEGGKLLSLTEVPA